MLNLQGVSPVSQDDGGLSHATRTTGKSMPDLAMSNEMNHCGR